MGTKIRIEALKGDKTTKEQFEKLYEYFIDSNYDIDDDDNDINIDDDDNDIITISGIYCPYSCADLDSQIKEELRKELKTR